MWMCLSMSICFSSLLSEGSWRQGLKQGEGCFRWAAGGGYRGSFVADQMHGSGTCTFANKDVYTGGWREQRERDGMAGCWLLAAGDWWWLLAVDV